MSIPASKTDLLEAISETFGKLMPDLERVSSALARIETLEGHAVGTTMSPRRSCGLSYWLERARPEVAGSG